MAKKIYKAVRAESQQEFEQAVTQALAEGWELQGGATVIFSTSKDRDGYTLEHWTYFQAVTKVEPEKPPESGWICR